MPLEYHATSGADAVTISWLVKKVHESRDGCRKTENVVRRSEVIPIYRMDCGSPGDMYMDGGEVKYSAVTSYSGTIKEDGYEVVYFIRQDSGAPCDCQDEDIVSFARNMETYCEPYFVPSSGGTTTFFVEYEWVTSGQCMGESVQYMIGSREFEASGRPENYECSPDYDSGTEEITNMQIGNNPVNLSGFTAIYGILRGADCNNECTDTSEKTSYIVLYDTMQYTPIEVPFSGCEVDVTFQYVTKTIKNCIPSTSTAMGSVAWAVEPRDGESTDHCDDITVESSLSWSPDSGVTSFVIPLSINQIGDGVGCDPVCESSTTYCVQQQGVKVYYPNGVDENDETIWDESGYLPISGGTVKIGFTAIRKTKYDDCTSEYENLDMECNVSFSGVTCECNGLVLSQSVDYLEQEGGTVQFEAEQYGESDTFIVETYQIDLKEVSEDITDDTVGGCCTVTVDIYFENVCK